MNATLTSVRFSSCAYPAGAVFHLHRSGDRAQDRLEPIIRAKAIALGADIRLFTQEVSGRLDDVFVR